MPVRTIFGNRLLLTLAAFCASMTASPHAFAAPTYLWTATATVPSNIGSNVQDITVADDGTMYVVGNSSTAFASLSASGTETTVINFSASVNAPNSRRIVGTGSTLFMSNSSGVNSKLFKLNLDSPTFASIFTSSGATGNLTVALAPDNGALFFTKSLSLQTIDRGTMLPTSIKSTATAAFRMVSNAIGSTLYYLTSAGILHAIDPTVGSSSDTTIASSLGSSSLLAIDDEENLYVLNTSGTLKKYTSTGVLLWTSTTTGAQRYGTGAMVIKGTKLYTVSVSRVVNVFNIDETPPSSPDGFTATAVGADVYLEWTNPNDADFYATTLIRSTERFATSVDDPVGGPAAPFEHQTFESYHDEGLESGTYYYSLFAEDIHGNISEPATFMVTVDATPPAAPTLSAEVTGNSIDLSWNVPSTTASFILRRTVNTGSPPANITDGTLVRPEFDTSLISLTQTSLEDGTYYYAIFAKDSEGNVSEAGVTTALVVDTTGPVAPELEAEAVFNDVHLTWTQPTDADIYMIRTSDDHAPADMFEGTLVTMLNDVASVYNHEGVSDGTHYYSIFARDAYGNYSNAGTASVTVSTPGDDLCDPLAHWTFDEDSPLAEDATGDGFDGTAYGNPPTLSTDVPDTGFSNPYSYAFSRASSQAIEIDRPVQSDFTICSWFKTTAAGNGTDHWLLMPLMESEVFAYGNEFGFGIDSGGKLAFGDSDDSTYVNVNGATTVNTGTWTHGCVTRQKSDGAIKLYVNGALDATGVGVTTVLNDNNYALIGAGSDGGAYWNGNIDDVRVYDTVLSAGDIASLAGATACGGSPRSSSSSESSSAPHQSNGGGRGHSGGATILRAIENKNLQSHEAAPATPVKTAVAPAMRERVCKRVMKWTNPARLKLVNARLQKWLGFHCS